MAEIIDGKSVSSEIREKIKLNVESLKKKYKSVPGLAVVLVGDDAPSAVYVRMKGKACEEATQKISLVTDILQSNNKLFQYAGLICQHLKMFVGIL